MKYAIIAAGEGSRLEKEGIKEPKPLVKVGGERLIDRLIRIFCANGATEIDVICNDLTPLVKAHLQQMAAEGVGERRIPLRYVVKTTPSSMHSFYEVSRLFTGDGPFCVTTVDTIFREEEFSEYAKALAEACGKGGQDGLMGVTDYVDDEKPLYVGTGDGMTITGFYDQSDTCKYISAGIYGLTPKSLDTLERCMERGESRMRNFQRALVADGLRLRAWPFSKVLDIDHASDIEKAVEFLTAQGAGSTQHA